jgi:hypothetical protein
MSGGFEYIAIWKHSRALPVFNPAIGRELEDWLRIQGDLHARYAQMLEISG